MGSVGGGWYRWWMVLVVGGGFVRKCNMVGFDVTLWNGWFWWWVSWWEWVGLGGLRLENSRWTFLWIVVFFSAIKGGVWGVGSAMVGNVVGSVVGSVLGTVLVDSLIGHCVVVSSSHANHRPPILPL